MVMYVGWRAITGVCVKFYEIILHFLTYLGPLRPKECELPYIWVVSQMTGIHSRFQLCRSGGSIVISWLVNGDIVQNSKILFKNYIIHSQSARRSRRRSRGVDWP